jgi:glucosamine--fructose-6-phosphate aminotransferase (isomerizing)
VERKPQRITWDAVQAEKGGYRHFMLKEIHEQPTAVRDTLLGRIGLEEGVVHLEELGPAAEKLRRARRVMLLACGTSWHAALVGKYLLEQVAKVPAEVDYGSEFRYRTPIVDPETLAVGISQSGETADTLAAFREVKKLGALPIAICNVQGSMITREAEGTLLTHAGPEIGVASTKAFTSQIVALALLALHLGRLRRRSSVDECRTLLESLARCPSSWSGPSWPAAASTSSRARWPRPRLPVPGPRHQLPDRPRGRAEDEGDLLHPRRGLSRGEMKHGPIALIDEAMPVVALCPQGRTYDKMLSNIQEVKARGGRVIAVVAEGDKQVREILDPGATSSSTCPRGRGLVAAADGDPAAAARLPHRGAGRARRGPAPQPRQVRHRRVKSEPSRRPSVSGSSLLSGLNPSSARRSWPRKAPCSSWPARAAARRG